MTTVVYIDAEFQGYMVPITGDPLFAREFQWTVPYLYKPIDGMIHRYHFLLSLGFIVFRGAANPEYYLATFPSIYGTDVDFANVQILEPGYTASAPSVATQLLDKKTAILAIDHQLIHLRDSKSAGRNARVKDRTDDLKFAFLSDLTPEQQGISISGHVAYNKGRDFKERSASNLAFNDFLEMLTNEDVVLIHKGANDLVALKNTCKLLGRGLPPFANLDLDHYSHVHKGVTDKRLDTLQKLYGGRYPELADRRDEMLEEVVKRIVARWGEEARGGVAAHNPLVDCVYALVVYEGLVREGAI
jgi:hypothetical protein